MILCLRRDGVDCASIKAAILLGSHCDLLRKILQDVYEKLDCATWLFGGLSCCLLVLWRRCGDRVFLRAGLTQRGLARG